MSNNIKTTRITAVFIALQYIAAFLIILLIATEFGAVGEYIKNVLFYILIFILPDILFISIVFKDKPLSYLKLNFNLKGILTGLVVGLFMTIIFLVSNGFKTNKLTFNTPEVLMLTGGVIAGIAEEIAFRGFYFNFFNRKFSFIIASIITAALFSLLHIRQIIDQGIVQLVMLFALALFLNYAYEKSKSLWVPIIIHMTFNTLIFLFR